jgi:uncharacterized protein
MRALLRRSLRFLRPLVRRWRRRRDVISVLPGALSAPSGVVAGRVTWCVTRPQRLRGVLGRPPLDPDEAYVICQAQKVHTVGVPYPLDVIFCDRRWRVLHVETLHPRSRSRGVAEALYCVELLGGRAAEAGIEPGQRLGFEVER